MGYFLGAADAEPGFIVAGCTEMLAGFCPSDNLVVLPLPLEPGLLDLFSAISCSLSLLLPIIATGILFKESRCLRNP